MQRLSIARSLRLALLGLTVVLAAVAAIGVSSLYRSRQHYEDTLARSSALATAAANLATAGIAEEEVLRDARGPAAAATRRQAAAAFSTAAGEAARLARDDPQSARLVASQVSAENTARALAASGQLSLATGPRGPLVRARAIAAELQGHQQVRQAQARSTARSSSRRAIILVAGAGLLALIGALALITLLVGSMRRPLDALVGATRDLAAGELERRVEPSGPRELQDLGTAFNAMGDDLLGAQFVATASHELRSPLTSIKGFVELLERSPENMSARQREFVDIILRSTDRLVDLVNDLLDVARIDADRVEINRRPIDVGEAVREVAELMGPQIEEKGQHLGVYVAGALPPALADPGRVRQIVANLLTNAHLYTGGGRAHPRRRRGRSRLNPDRGR